VSSRAAAAYEALAHRVLTLVQGRLSERETRVFVWSFLYMQPSEATATALGLSLPRVKKDRKRIVTKVGTQVWAVLGGELDLCAAYREQSLPAIFEILSVHVEDCPACAAALGGVRRGALAIVGPEMLVLTAASSEGAAHVLADLVHGAAVRLNGLLHRGTEALTSVPPSGRTAAAVAVAATVVAGGAATVAPVDHQRRPPRADIADRGQGSPRRAPSPPMVVAPAATAPARVPASPRATPTPTRKRSSKQRPAAPGARRDPAAVATSAQETVTFEQQAPRPAAAAAEAPSAAPPAAAPATPPTEEFGFEQG